MTRSWLLVRVLLENFRQFMNSTTIQELIHNWRCWKLLVSMMGDSYCISLPNVYLAVFKKEVLCSFSSQLLFWTFFKIGWRMISTFSFTKFHSQHCRRLTLLGFQIVIDSLLCVLIAFSLLIFVTCTKYQLVSNFLLNHIQLTNN